MNYLLLIHHAGFFIFCILDFIIQTNFVVKVGLIFDYFVVWEFGLYFTNVLYRLKADYTTLKWVMIMGTTVHGVTHFIQAMLLTAFFVGKSALPAVLCVCCVSSCFRCHLIDAVRGWRCTTSMVHVSGAVRCAGRALLVCIVSSCHRVVMCVCARACAGMGQRMERYHINKGVFALYVILSYSLIVYQFYLEKIFYEMWIKIAARHKKEQQQAAADVEEGKKAAAAADANGEVRYPAGINIW